MNRNKLTEILSQEEKMLLLTQGQREGDYDQTYEIPHLGIKPKYLADGPHGVRTKKEKNCTSFPNLCCVAATWDKELCFELGSAIAHDCIEHRVDVLLGPGANIKRHVLCGRNFEYFSEDPVLSGEMAAGYISGLQQKGVSACLKHFALNNQEKHREYVSVEVDERTLREIYLKSFEIAVKKSSPHSVMCSYNKMDSVWCSENPYLLREILKEEWGYKGVVISDWGAVHDVSRAIGAGLDMQMPRNKNIVSQLSEGLEKGLLTQEDIDGALDRVLDFVTKPAPEKVNYDRAAQHDTARRIAASGIVLLKNNDRVLPLTAEKYKKITLVGEYAVSPLIGGQGAAEVFAEDEYVDSPLDELKKQLDGIEISYYEGYGKTAYSETMLWPKMREFADHIADSDAVVLFMGTMTSEDTEKFDRRSASLNPNFSLFAEKAFSMGKKVISVIQSGSAVILDEITAFSHSIAQAWLGGEAAGGAVADALCGRVNPSGKLPETFPLCERKDLPYPGDGLKIQYSEGQNVGYRYYDKHPEETAYPFGHGLSYTAFDYSNLVVQPGEGKLLISLDVTNTGEYDGAEVVQIYVGKDVSCYTRPIKELKAFEKVFINSGETKRVSLEINVSELGVYNRSLHRYVVEPGSYTVFAASSSKDVRLTSAITLNTPAPYSIGQKGKSMMA